MISVLKGVTDYEVLETMASVLLQHPRNHSRVAQRIPDAEIRSAVNT